VNQCTKQISLYNIRNAVEVVTRSGPIHKALRIPELLNISFAGLTGIQYLHISDFDKQPMS
jgi:hypothetical protein